MDFESLDWSVLDRLRGGFLAGQVDPGVYWNSQYDLEQYDLTFGERIGWKWDAVLRELQIRRWVPLPNKLSGLTLLDWGCGSGVAGRRVLAALDPKRFQSVFLWDHSSHARDFAIHRARKDFPDLTVTEWKDQAVDVLVLSHVLNELSSKVRESLQALIERCEVLIWVEPGTHTISRDLIGFREKLRATFHVIAPCTHRNFCGLLAPANASHWCHNFADPPPAIYADSDWVKFGQRAGIDLRSLPYSFLVMEKFNAAHLADDGASRIIGAPRHYKGFAKLLNCDAAGVVELTLQKRDQPELFKDLKRSSDIPVYRWHREGDRIVQGAKIADQPTSR